MLTPTPPSLDLYNADEFVINDYNHVGLCMTNIVININYVLYTISCYRLYRSVLHAWLYKHAGVGGPHAECHSALVHNVPPDILHWGAMSYLYRIAKAVINVQQAGF